MRNNRIFIDKTPLEKYFEDLFIQWTNETTNDSEVSYFQGTELQDIKLNPNYIEFSVISFFPSLKYPLMKNIHIELKDRLTAVNTNGIKAVIRQPAEYLTIPYARVEPYLVMFDIPTKTDKIIYDNLAVTDPLSITMGDGALFIGAELPAINLKVSAESADNNAIKMINGLRPTDSNITISGGNNISIVVSDHPFSKTN